MRTLIGMVACVALLAPVSASALTMGKLAKKDSGSLLLDSELTQLREAARAVWAHNEAVGKRDQLVSWSLKRQIQRHKSMQRGALALRASANEVEGQEVVPSIGEGDSKMPGGVNPVPEPSAALVFAAGATIASARLRRRRNA